MYDLVCYNTDDNIIDKLWQWDSDRIIVVKDIETTENIVFHFGNRKNKTTLKVTPTTNKDGNLEVKIPNCLLRQPCPIQIYVYEGTAEDDDTEGQTICTTQIPVRERPEPDSIEYEDIEDHVDYLKELVERTEVLETNLSQSIEDAENTIENLNSKIEEFTSEADSLVNRINNEIDIIKAETSKFITDANTSKEALQTEINDIIEGANTSKENISSEVDAIISGANTSKETFQTEIDDVIENANVNKENIINEINTIVSDAVTAKEILQTKITESSELLTSLQEENTRAEENIKTLQDENVSVVEEFVLNGEALPIENRSVSVNLPFLEAVDFVFIEDEEVVAIYNEENATEVND